MKKLIVVLAVVITAAVSHAATMSWLSGGIGTPDGATATAANVTAKIILLSASDYTSLDTAMAGKSAADVSKYIYDTYKGTPSSVTPTWSKGQATFKETATYAAGDTTYAAVLFTATSGADEYYIGNYATWTFASAVNKQFGNMGTKLNGSGDALAWTKASSGGIPEPTSGLLLVLGGAMLALRRRRA